MYRNIFIIVFKWIHCYERKQFIVNPYLINAEKSMCTVIFIISLFLKLLTGFITF